MLNLPDFYIKGLYVRIGAISLEEGIEYIRQARFLSRKTRILMGVNVNFEGNRLATFLYKGVACAACTRSGSYFAIERCRFGQPNLAKYHANLWGIDLPGSHFLMTSDHIVPKSKGGMGAICNRQPMCAACNNKKADLVPEEFRKQQLRAEYRKRVLRERAIR